MNMHRWLVIGLTALLALAGFLFSIPEYNEIISVPQHGYFEDLQKVSDLMLGNSLCQTSYYAFFIVDLLWAPALLTLIYRYLCRPKPWWPLRPLSGNLLSGAFFILAGVAYVFDILENISYLLFTPQLIPAFPLKTIVDFKSAMYALTLLVMILFYYQKYVAEKIPEIKSAIRSSFLSILTMLLLAGLATLMDQGSTVIVHLLEHPFSLFLTLLLLNLLALVSAHYPDYLDKYFHKNFKVNWEIHPLRFGNPFKGMGLITYQEKSMTDASATTSVVRQTSSQQSAFFNHFRKIIGAMVMITWLYVLLFVFKKYEYPTLSLSLLLPGIAFLALQLHFRSALVKKHWGAFVKKNQKANQPIDELIGSAMLANNEEERIPGQIISFSKATLFIFLLLIFCSLLTIGLSFTASWVITWYMLAFTTIINIIFIILFQQFRTTINLPLLSDSFNWIPITGLGKDLTYVRFFALMGFVILLLFMCTTYDPGVINALPIILMFVYLVYGLVVTVLKHHLYYSAETNSGLIAKTFPVTARFFKEYVPILGLLFLLWMMFNGIAGNGLHKIPMRSEVKDNVLSMEAYIANLKSNPKEEIYLISSYGGGLRATAWTMLLLDSIQKNVPDFFDRSLAMSGVSGGFLGLSFYTAAQIEQHNAHARSNAIEAIGKHNLLAIDISYLLGFDFIREMIPYVKNFHFRDRAGRSMDTYAGLLQPIEKEKIKMLESTYRNYWFRAYQQAQQTNANYPVLIGNTTGTQSQYGVAFPLDYPKGNHPFPGAVDILSFEDQKEESISYLDATSTTERFPVFSPAADISKKGNFLDGGYFENSGLLSLINFYEYLQQNDSLDLQDKNTKVIVLINSKEAYIRKILGGKGIAKNNKATSELGAILRTITDVTTLSLALEEKYEKRFGKNYIPIYLPYPVSYDDVIRQIGGIPEDPFAVWQILRESNKKVNTALAKAPQKKDTPIPPALARVLSKPGYYYIRAMLLHEDVADAFAKIKY